MDDSDYNIACASEKIHAIGQIQSHGLLFALSPRDLLIRYVSENVREHLELEPQNLIGRPILELLQDETRASTQHLLEAAVENFVNPLEVSFKAVADRFEGIANYTEARDYILLDLESVEKKSADESGEHTVGVDNYFEFVQRSLRLTSVMTSPLEAANIVASEIKRFTGFDRVMVYRFSEDYSGEVIAESREAHLEPYLGLRYPASDIPPQARALYLKNWVRLLKDVEDVPSRLYPPAAAGEAQALDLSKSVLRALSPIHIQYLKNMGVSATLTISLISGGELWGLIACHHYSPRFVEYRIRSTCALYGVVMSAQIVNLENKAAARDESRVQKEVSTMLRDLTETDGLFNSLSRHMRELLPIFRADGVAVVLGEQISVFGSTPAKATLLSALKTTDSQQEYTAFFTDCLLRDWPAFYDPDSGAAGMIFVTVSDNCYIMLFRNECQRSVNWAGNPYDSKSLDEVGRLTPRSSFKKWTEQVENASEPWGLSSHTAVDELRSGLASFIVKRNQQLEELNRQIAAKNLQVEQFVFAVSHDLKSPLVTCSGYADALEEDLAIGDTAMVVDSIQRIKKSVNRMGAIINDLLDLCRVGAQEGRIETIDIAVLTTDIVQSLEPQIEAVGAEVIIKEGLPNIVARRLDVQRAIENLVVNALRYGCSENEKRIEIGVGDRLEQHDCIFVRDFGTGIDPKYHDTIFEIFQRLSSDKTGTGVGLTSVKKVMEQLEGRVILDSVPSQGATFWLCFKQISSKK